MSKLSKLMFLTLLVALLPALLGARYSEEGLAPGWTYHDYYDPKEKERLNTVNKYHFFQGIEKMHKKQYQYAYKDIAFMLHYFPNHPIALELMGQLSLKMNRPEIGEDYYKKAFETYPQSIKAGTHVSYGRFLLATGRLRESIDSCETALTMSRRPTEMADAHYCLGLAHFALKDYKLANEQAQKAYAKGAKETELRENLISTQAWSP